MLYRVHLAWAGLGLPLLYTHYIRFTQPKLSVQIAKTFLVLCPTPVEIRFSHVSLYNIKDQYDINRLRSRTLH
jgi:hypothetical protein